MNNKELYLHKENFNTVCQLMKIDDKVIDCAFLYDCYRQVVESLITILESQNAPILGKIQPPIIISYLLNEHLYSSSGLTEKQKKELEDNTIYQRKICSIAIDKYFSLDNFKYEEGYQIDRFFPPITLIRLYTNFILHLLRKFAQKNPQQTLMIDILHKGFMMCECITELLVSGFETEAFSTWRTLHETECIAILIFKYGKPLIDAYLRHIKYGLAFRNALGTKEEQDQVFVEIKSQMKDLGLKSKDMKRFIECGWLYSVPDLDKYEDFRLNFRNGTEYLAGLSNMNDRYEMSSEIAHSSPLLIYSNREFFFFLTIVSLYESFLRLEVIFNEVYNSSMNEKEQKEYQLMRDSYLPQLRITLDMETHRLEQLNKNY